MLSRSADALSVGIETWLDDAGSKLALHVRLSLDLLHQSSDFREGLITDVLVEQTGREGKRRRGEQRSAAQSRKLHGCGTSKEGLKTK